MFGKSFLRVGAFWGAGVLLANALTDLEINKKGRRLPPFYCFLF